MIVVKAPCKVIVTGEHAVVYGCPAVAMSIALFNTVSIWEENGDPGFELRAKENVILLDEKGELITGKTPWPVFVQLLKNILQKTRAKPEKKVVVEIESSVPKGVGASSSIAAAFTLAVHRYLDKQVSNDELFNHVQFVDAIAHGGSPSGIDAMTVLFGSTELTRVVDNNSLSWKFKQLSLSFPTGSELIVVDTSRGGSRVGTGEMIKKFAANMGLLQNGKVKQLTKLTDSDKQRLEPFCNVAEKIAAQLVETGSAVELGKLLNENHELLRNAGVSSPEIEEAVQICSENTYGAKLTGAGGQGGAVIALVDKSNAGELIKKLVEKNFNAFKAKQTRGILQ